MAIKIVKVGILTKSHFSGAKALCYLPFIRKQVKNRDKTFLLKRSVVIELKSYSNSKWIKEKEGFEALGKKSANSYPELGKSDLINWLFPF
ncbi:hypothetical protein QML68_02575 [Providencia huaxiensis]|nr:MULTISPECIES: hypothetical protein [Providencia]MDI7238576.1 hypothetical protein [Providencia huaxiensis]